jgi:hypothetical protein
MRRDDGNRRSPLRHADSKINAFPFMAPQFVKAAVPIASHWLVP